MNKSIPFPLSCLLAAAMVVLSVQLSGAATAPEVAMVNEPSMMILFGTGLIGIAGLATLKKRNKK